MKIDKKVIKEIVFVAVIAIICGILGFVIAKGITNKEAKPAVVEVKKEVKKEVKQDVKKSDKKVEVKKEIKK